MTGIILLSVIITGSILNALAIVEILKWLKPVIKKQLKRAKRRVINYLNKKV